MFSNTKKGLKIKKEHSYYTLGTLVEKPALQIYRNQFLNYLTCQREAQ